MAKFSRRSLLQAAAATTGGVILSGGLDNMIAQAAGGKPAKLALQPVADLRDGIVRLTCRRASSIDRSTTPTSPRRRRSCSTTAPCCPADTTAWAPSPDPTATSGWSATTRSPGRPSAAFGPGTPYDTRGGGGTTTTEVTPDGQVVQAFTSLNGTQKNCSGGVMPWGRGSPARRRSTAPTSVPTSPARRTPPSRNGTASSSRCRPAGNRTAQPITSAGRFAHEAAAYSPDEGIVYLTEDNFAFPSGFYRYIPPAEPDDGRPPSRRRPTADAPSGRAAPTRTSRPARQIGATYPVDWVDIDDPNPTFPYTGLECRPTSERRRV